MSNAVITINERAGMLKLHGGISEEAAMDFSERLDLLVRYYQHRSVVLHINSDGGNAGALRHMLDEMQRHRDNGCTFATFASFKACSAAALLLASGEPRQRRVSRQSFLLFHQARHAVEANRSVTADDALRLAGMLVQVDNTVEQALVTHLTVGFGGIVALAEEGEARCQLLYDQAAAFVNQQVALSEQSMVAALQAIRDMWAACISNKSAQPYMKLLQSRFARDVWMELFEAYALVLIDAVDHVPAILPQASHRARLRVSHLIAA